MAEPVPWAGSFVVDDDPAGAIRLRQVGVKDFALESTVRYVGARTGLEGRLGDAVLDDIRGAGIAAAYAAVWVLPPTVLGFLGYVAYAAVEGALAKVVSPERAGDESLRYEEF